MQLFQPPEKKGTINDPYMINPKGVRVMVPASRVPELITQGFILEDRLWQPIVEKKDDERVVRDYPMSRKQLLEETQKKIDTLDVWEI